MLVFSKLNRYIVIYNNVFEPNLLKRTYINDISVGYMIKQYMLYIYTPNITTKYKVLLYCGRNNVAVKYITELCREKISTRIYIYRCQYKIKFNPSFLDPFRVSKNSQLYEICQLFIYGKNMQWRYSSYRLDFLKKN